MSEQVSLFGFQLKSYSGTVNVGPDDYAWYELPHDNNTAYKLEYTFSVEPNDTKIIVYVLERDLNISNRWIQRYEIPDPSNNYTDFFYYSSRGTPWRIVFNNFAIPYSIKLAFNISITISEGETKPPDIINGFDLILFLGTLGFVSIIIIFNCFKRKKLLLQ